jgi:hypothetical protein
MIGAIRASPGFSLDCGLRKLTQSRRRAEQEKVIAEKVFFLLPVFYFAPLRLFASASKNNCERQ